MIFFGRINRIKHKSHSDINRNRYNSIPTLRAGKKRLPEIFLEKIFCKLILKLNLNRDDVLLDLGCGAGKYAIIASRFVKKVIAVDFAVQQLRNAPKRQNIFYVAMDAENLCFKRGKIDKIICISAIELFSDYERVVSQLKGYISPTAQGLIVFPNIASIHYKAWVIMNFFFSLVTGIKIYQNRITIENLTRVLLKNNLHVIKTGQMIHVPVSLVSRCPKFLQALAIRLDSILGKKVRTGSYCYVYFENRG